MYTVKQAAALTGVAEATLRVWERRYGVVRPERSDGGYRLYDDHELALLRRMAALVGDGVPAARAATLAHAPKAEATSHLPGHDLVTAAVSLDSRRLAEVVDGAFAAAPFEQVVSQWLMPELRRLGDAWASGEVTIAQEHFASAGLMRAVGVVFEATGAVDGPTVLAGTPSGDHHELALFTFAACLRRVGVDAIYLGGDVPAGEWAGAAARRGARAAVVGITRPGSVAAARAVARELSTMTPAPSVWAGGPLRHEVQGARALTDDVAVAARELALALAAGQA